MEKACKTSKLSGLGKYLLCTVESMLVSDCFRNDVCSDLMCIYLRLAVSVFQTCYLCISEMLFVSFRLAVSVFQTLLFDSFRLYCLYLSDFAVCIFQSLLLVSFKLCCFYLSDLLFGSCQTVFTRALKGENKFELETNQIERLEEEIRRLIEAGFTWKDAFTQCTLQNALLAFSRGRTFNRRLCEAALVDAADVSTVNGEIANVLLNLLESGKVDELPQNDDQIDDEYDDEGLVNSNKRDEIVQVHKYFDKSTGLFKRNLYYKTPYRYLDLNDLPESEYQQALTYRTPPTESLTPLLEESTSLSENDIADPNLDDIKGRSGNTCNCPYIQ